MEASVNDILVIAKHPMASSKALNVLKTVFGYSQFRDQQEEIINHIIEGNDALILMPTGGGKSLCYQVPALCRDGLAIVISPLIALMQDQVDALKEIGVKAAYINSSLKMEQAILIKEQMIDGELDIVYVSPERLNTDDFLDCLSDCELALFAIDEAHCVSQWGHDFRPDYTELAKLKKRFPDIPRVALTATADARTQRDIIKYLSLESARVFISSFDRKNIYYKISPKNNEKKQLLDFIKAEHPQDSGIVYCLSRAKVEKTVEWLSKQGFNALAYHAGLDARKREKNQSRFIKEEAVIMVATIAFGMGIDKPDVRFVAHLDLPKSIEAYYQETGRAGRDGLAANAFLVYGAEDIVKLRQFIQNSNAPKEQKMIENKKLEDLIGLVEALPCRRKILLEYFDEKPVWERCSNCDNCLEPVQGFNASIAIQKALSCIYRTGQRFGILHNINVLLGKEDERIKKLAHDQLSTFGIGKEYSESQWRSIFRQIIALGLIDVDMDSFGILKLNENSMAALKGEREIFLREDTLPAKTKEKLAKDKLKHRSARSLDDLSALDKSLFNRLKALRLSLAKEHKLAPYMVFHDTTLHEMLSRRPSSLAEMAELTGVGTAKLNKYGQKFLDELLSSEALS